MQAELAVPVTAARNVEEAVGEADIICTVTAAAEPILKGAWVRPGTHLNLVGSSYAGPAEVDNDLVVRSRFIADSREGVLDQGAEFLRAKAAGLVGDEHIVAEIGQVLAGEIEGPPLGGRDHRLQIPWPYRPGFGNRMGALFAERTHILKPSRVSTQEILRIP